VAITVRRFPPPAFLTRLAQHSRIQELLPKNSKNSPRHTISQNNMMLISVCTLACAARFRANAWSTSVGMIGLLMPTLLRKNNVTAPLQFPTERRNGVGRSSERPAIERQATHQRRGAADCDQHGEAAGAVAERITRIQAPQRSSRCTVDLLRSQTKLFTNTGASYESRGGLGPHD